jgi:hypothetical protein
MVGTRRISASKYIIAFIFSTLIFVIGVLVGNALSKERIDYLKEIADKQQLDYKSLELQSLYISSFELKNESCLAFRKILEKSLDDVAKAQGKAEMYMKQRNDARYDDIKRDYSMAQIRYLLLDKKVRDICKFDTASLLYFYSDKECPDCSPQGTILTYLKEKMQDKLLIFSLDVDFKQEPLIELFKLKYNITAVPSIIVNEAVYQGLMKKEEVLQAICPLYGDKPDICIQA